MGLGEIEKAKIIFKELLKIFEHWCIYERLYQIEKNKSNLEEAVNYASKAALFDREHKMRISLYKDLGDFLVENDMKEVGELHYRVVNIIRKEQGWKEDISLEAKITDSNIKNENTKIILGKLNRFWKEYKYKNVIFTEGVIEKILEGNRSGFIKDFNGKSYYFRMSNFKNKREAKEGIKVKFLIKEGFDTKKNRPSFEAVEIECV